MSDSGGVPIPALIAVWYGASCLAITTSKLVTNAAADIGAGGAFTLCFAQFLTATLASAAAIYIKGGKAPATLTTEATALWKTALPYTMGFMLTNVAFSLAGAQSARAPRRPSLRRRTSPPVNDDSRPATQMRRLWRPSSPPSRSQPSCSHSSCSGRSSPSLPTPCSSPSVSATP